MAFQHNPPPITLELIRLALKSLRPSGLAAFQCQIYRKDYGFSLPDYLAASPNSGMEMHAIPQAEVFAMIASSGCTLVEVREDSVWPGILSNMFVVRHDQVDGLRGQIDQLRAKAETTERAAREALATEQAARAKAEAEAAALRQADQERRARGLVARIRSASRGE